MQLRDRTDELNRTLMSVICVEPQIVLAMLADKAAALDIGHRFVDSTTLQVWGTKPQLDDLFSDDAYRA